MSLESVAQRHGVEACVGCDRCEQVCPVRWADERFSPGQLVQRCLQGGPLGESGSFTLWTCTGCRACLAKCGETSPDFAAFVSDAREEAREAGYRPGYPYGGALQAIMRLSADERYTQQRLQMLPCELRRPARRGGALFLLGMAPYFSDAVSPELGEVMRESVAAGFKLLEELGLEPGALSDEIACGHDFLWTGERDRFRRHARALSAQINDTLPGVVVTGSQIIAETLRHDYPAVGYPVESRVLTLTELLAERRSDLAEKGRLRASDRTVCIHSESRRSDGDRHFDALERVVGAVPETELTKLSDDGPAHTVGVSGFSVCGGWAASLQGRLMESARSNGADCVVTSCVDAAVHLRCLCRQGAWCRAAVEVMDAPTFVYRHLVEESDQ